MRLAMFDMFEGHSFLVIIKLKLLNAIQVTIVFVAFK